jgi:hypothetical protein
MQNNMHIPFIPSPADTKKILRIELRLKDNKGRRLRGDVSH